MSVMSTLTRIAYDWADRCFGSEHVINLPLRALRHAEESIELAQAVGTPREYLHKVVDQVYERPIGDPVQELGGSLLTACVLARAMGVTPEEAFERELTRVLAKSPEHFATRNRQKMNLDALKRKPTEVFVKPGLGGGPCVRFDNGEVEACTEDDARRYRSIMRKPVEVCMRPDLGGGAYVRFDTDEVEACTEADARRYRSIIRTGSTT